MGKNKLLYAVLTLLLATPQIHTEVEANSDWVMVDHPDTTTPDTTEQHFDMIHDANEIRAQDAEHRQSEYMRKTSPTPTKPVTTTSSDPSIKMTFQEPTTFQKIADFLNRIFGDSGTVRDALRSKDGDKKSTPKLSPEQTAAFQGLNPAEQLHDLNEWLNTEKEKPQTTKDFNTRIARFQHDIQTIISDKTPGIQLKYNVESGEFEYHKAKSPSPANNAPIDWTDKPIDWESEEDE